MQCHNMSAMSHSLNYSVMAHVKTTEGYDVHIPNQGQVTYNSVAGSAGLASFLGINAQNLLGGLGGMWGNRGGYGCGCGNPVVLSESDHLVTRFEMEQENKLAAKDSEIALLKSNIFTDQKITETYKELRGMITGLQDFAARQSVQNQAFMDSIRMYEWAFANLSYELVAPKDMIVSEVNVNYSWKTDHMRLVPKSDFRTLVPTGTNEGSVLIEPIDKPETVDAPIKAGDVACKAKIIYADNEIATIDLVYAESVSRNYLLYGWGLLMKLFSNTIFKILVAVVVLGVIVYIALVMRTNAMRKKKRNQLKIVKINDMNKPQKTKKQDRNYKPKH